MQLNVLDSGSSKKPEWLKIRPPTTKSYKQIKQMVKPRGLATVCQEAHCPNIAECWSSGTATFMVLGDTCTRGCRFCAIKSARYGNSMEELKSEPEELARTVKEMNLNYIVITSVDRDDLEDQGSNHFAECVKAVKQKNPNTTVELLIPDFSGEKKLIENVVKSGAEVIGHNVETVKRLQSQVRDRRANYEQSLKVLKTIKELNPKIFTKTGIMVGLGETKKEVLELMNDLRKIDVDIFTIGQYLQPSEKHFPLQEYVHPETFKFYEQKANELQFKATFSGPFVRSSYKAGEVFIEKLLRSEKNA